MLSEATRKQIIGQSKAPPAPALAAVSAQVGAVKAPVPEIAGAAEDSRELKLFLEAVFKVAFGFAILAALLFVPAGSLNYPGAWLMIGLLFVPMIIIGSVLFLKAPDLLARRLNTKEQNVAQRKVLSFSLVLFPAMLILSGLDFRFSMSRLPGWASPAAGTVFLIGYLLYAEVLRENAYLSRTVEVQQGQKLIDKGAYGVVRHPMYASTILMFVSMPLVLGSFWAFLLMLVCYPVIIAFRIRDEEKTLAEGLEGYLDYMKRVKYRILPYIW